MKVITKLGEMEFAREGDKYQLAIPPDSFVAETLSKFNAENWVTLLEKCKDNGMKADEIMTATNKDGNQVVLSSENQESLLFLCNTFAELANINKGTTTPSKPEEKRIDIDIEAAKEASKKLGF